MQQINEKNQKFRHGDYGPKYMFRGPNIDWGIIVLKKGIELGYHYHNIVEETFYLVDGNAKFIINDKVYEAIEGDAFRMEPGDKHNIIPVSDTIKLIFIKYPYNPDDKVDVK
ncbi:MAG: cupin domain-containing protein [Candidatus Hydrogenedentota bacterium]